MCRCRRQNIGETSLLSISATRKLELIDDSGFADLRRENLVFDEPRSIVQVRVLDRVLRVYVGTDREGLSSINVFDQLRIIMQVCDGVHTRMRCNLWSSIVWYSF